MLAHIKLWLLLLFSLFFKFCEVNGYHSNSTIFYSPTETALTLQKYADRTNLSGKCSKALGEYTKALLEQKPWALMSKSTFMDATSKIPSGVLSGDNGDVGAFDQCLDVENHPTAEIITGRFCLGSLSISDDETLTNSRAAKSEISNKSLLPEILKFGACFPHACSAQEMQGFYLEIGMNVSLPEELCQDRFSGPEMTLGVILTIGFLGAVLLIVVLSTVYDVILYLTQKKPAHILLLAFSAKKNIQVLLTTSNNPTELRCLHGIRAISLAWIITAHKYYVNLFGITVSNNKLMIQWVRNPTSMFALAGPIAVETFFVLSGLLCCYNYMNSLKNGTFSVLKHYLYRYLRITPALGAVVLFYAMLLEHCGSGPFWNYIKLLSLPCQYLWWSTMFYIPNYLNPIHTCVGVSWYLAVDTHLYLLSPLLLIPLQKHPRLTLFIVGCLAFCSTLSPILIIWFLKLREVIVTDRLFITTDDFMTYYYVPTHTRAAPWFMGFLLGYLIHKIKSNNVCNQIKTKRYQMEVVLFWGVILSAMIGCVFCGHNVIVGEYDRLGNTLHVGLAKLIWSSAIVLVIVACETGHGGPINRLLSLPIFHFLSKLSYCMYLVHIGVMSVKELRTRTTAPFGNFRLLYEIWADYIFTMFVAVILMLGFEQPFYIIGNAVLKKPKDKTYSPTFKVKGR